MVDKNFFHSVTLDKEKCKGCTNCIKKCPTEAIRVRDGKAHIINERCIDCGECIRICPYHAKKATVDNLSILNNYKYNIALPAPSLYSQFKKQNDVNVILTALTKIGFDNVFEVAKAADIVTEATKIIFDKSELKKPVINSACPAVVKLIRIRFPNLIEHILPIHAPMEIAAMLARKNAMEKFDLKSEEIGVFFISPCPAKVTVAKTLQDDRFIINGVLSISDIYVKVLSMLSHIDEPLELSDSSFYGVNWATSGGETEALIKYKEELGIVSVNGITNVIKIFEQMEDDQLKDIDFVEVNACQEGCLGGALTVENTYLSKLNLKRIAKIKKEEEVISLELNDILMKEKMDYIPVMKLNNDIQKAMEMLDNIDKIYDELPGIDCGSCGAPSCKALAEDIVRGFAQTGDCIFKMREKVQTLINEMLELESHMPPPFRNEKS